MCVHIYIYIKKTRVEIIIVNSLINLQSINAELIDAFDQLT